MQLAFHEKKVIYTGKEMKGKKERDKEMDTIMQVSPGSREQIPECKRKFQNEKVPLAYT